MAFTYSPFARAWSQQDEEVRLLKSAADQLGYKLVKKSK